jgi:hypothetical protein
MILIIKSPQLHIEKMHRKVDSRERYVSEKNSKNGMSMRIYIKRIAGRKYK